MVEKFNSLNFHQIIGNITNPARPILLAQVTSIFIQMPALLLSYTIHWNRYGVLLLSCIQLYHTLTVFNGKKF